MTVTHIICHSKFNESLSASGGVDITLQNLEATVKVSHHVSLVFLPPALARLDLCCSLNLPHHEGQIPSLLLRQKCPGSERSRDLLRAPQLPGSEAGPALKPL